MQAPRSWEVRWQHVVTKRHRRRLWWGKHHARSRTTHLVFAIIIALVASNAEARRSLGSNSVNTLESWMGVFSFWVKVLVMRGTAGAACERIPNGHGDDGCSSWRIETAECGGAL
jgi:hypothetical protein